MSDRIRAEFERWAASSRLDLSIDRKLTQVAGIPVYQDIVTNTAWISWEVCHHQSIAAQIKAEQERIRRAQEALEQRIKEWQ